jgi:hypothetical protein
MQLNTQNCSYCLVMWVNFLFHKSKQPSHDLHLFAYINSKFLHVERHIRVQLEQMYLDIIRQECETERRSLQIMLSQPLVNPLEFAYDYSNGPGYTVPTKSLRGFEKLWRANKLS